MVDKSTWHPSDAELMMNLMKQGCDLDEVRRIEHFFIAPDKNSVALILQALPRIGHELDHLSEYQGDAGAYLVCSIEMISPSELTKKTGNLMELMKLYNALYDGWATTV